MHPGFLPPHSLLCAGWAEGRAVAWVVPEEAKNVVLMTRKNHKRYRRKKQSLQHFLRLLEN